MSLPTLPFGWGERALAETAAIYGVSGGELIGRGRRENIVEARLACYGGLRLAGASYEAIGLVLERDHTTVIAGVRRAVELAEVDTHFADAVQRIAAAAAQRTPAELAAPASGSVRAELDAQRQRIAELEQRVAELAELLDRGLAELSGHIGTAGAPDIEIRVRQPHEHVLLTHDGHPDGWLSATEARQAWQADLDGCQTMPGYTKELEWQLGSLLELAEQGTMDDVQLFAKIVRSIGFSTYPPRKAMAWLADYRGRAAARRKEKETNDGE